MASTWPSAMGLDPRAPNAAVGVKPLKEDNKPEQNIVEGWAQGFNVGAVILLILLLLCNYRKGILLHKLILLELILALFHGFFIFFEDEAYGWILSSTAVPLYLSYNLHNVISWLKIKPFLPKWGSRFFIITLMFVQPYWILETWANFEYFNGLGGKIEREVFTTSRFFEPLMRDPWWVFTTVKLVLVIKRNYEYTFSGLVKASPRFGVMLLCMFLSIVFLITDVVITAKVSKQSGINPFWRLALVFKCASDTIFLDDFKSVLDEIAESARRRIMSLPYHSKRRKSSARPGDGRTSHHEHNAGPSVSISANREGEQRVGAGKRAWVGLTSKRRDSGELELIGEDHQQHGQIMAETTITISDQNRKARNGSQSTASPMQYSNERPGNYGWGEPPAGTSSIEEKDGQKSIPMMPMPAKTNVRPFS